MDNVVNKSPDLPPRLDVLLIMPPLGSFDEVLRDIPLSLVYAAADSVEKGYKVEILDLRLYRDKWRQEIDKRLDGGARLAGLSVMTGNPIATSLEISQYIRVRHQVPIVWGGPHPTIFPEQTLREAPIEYLIRAWGSKSLCKLIAWLRGEGNDLQAIPGIAYLENEALVLGPPQCEFEMIDFEKLPYYLVDQSPGNYRRGESHEVVFPIFTSMGCPYQCTFCLSPWAYRDIEGPKWKAYPIEDVLRHIGFLRKQYGVNFLHIYDDDSFVDLSRMKKFFHLYITKRYHRDMTIHFRGMRINEMDRFDEEMLGLMQEANVEMAFIGVESGSDKVLKIMRKGINVKQIIRVNKKFANYPSIHPHYNFMCGVPGEEMQDLRKTGELLIQLQKDNPSCFLGRGGEWKPLPGTVLTDRAVKDYGLELPTTLKGWIAIDTYMGMHLSYPWYTAEMKRQIKLLQMAGLLLDRKIEIYAHRLGPLLGTFARMSAKLMRPLVSFRLKHGINRFLVEHYAYLFFSRNLSSLVRLVSKLQGDRV